MPEWRKNEKKRNQKFIKGQPGDGNRGNDFNYSRVGRAGFNFQEPDYGFGSYHIPENIRGQFRYLSMMKGYLTVFLALSLSVMTGFVLLLTGGAVRNAGKVRLECAVDTGMNAVLSEFHTVLLERYDLVYVDISYLGQSPSISNMEDRLYYYVEENTSKVLEGENAPWGRIMVENVSIPDFETAAADLGASMRNQDRKSVV